MGERGRAVQGVNDGKQILQVKNCHTMLAITLPVGDPVAQDVCNNFPFDTIKV